MFSDFSKMISTQVAIPERQVIRTLELLENGSTIPFISRYRKEVTGGLDEVQVGAVKDLYDKLCELQKRKETILTTIDGQGKLSAELKLRITQCWNSTELEDIYLPYKPKRRTRAEIARQKGLEPLAMYVLLQSDGDLQKKAASYLNDEVANVKEALQGASDIIAEQVSEDQICRNKVRQQFAKQALITSKIIKGKEEDAIKYRDYFDFSEPLKRCSSHRLLALRRAEHEGFVRINISVDDATCTEHLQKLYVKSNNESAQLIAQAVADGYQRLLKPSIETEFSASSKLLADEEAIKVFAENLKQLLLAPPLGSKRVLGIDPGFRTGCKLVCIDEQGNLIHNETIYPHPPRNESSLASRKVQQLVEQYEIHAIAIGNGTASRETESFITSLQFNRKVQAFVVSEDGASIYSASATAREEFPDYDVTVRGAVSIGRRLMDPLAELVKIDPKSIGVGQYQHDVDQGKLKKTLDQTIINCVNSVGVNLNTASRHLLTYVSGLGPVLAQNIVDYRTQNGAFSSRKQLMKVPRMGSKAFEQSAGFLRIPQAKNPLDNTAVHPETYAIVEKMAKDLNSTVEELINDKSLRLKIKLDNYISPTCGLPTLTDIIKELDKPGRDPRNQIKAFSFDPNVRHINDLKEGMVLPGIISNITNFGCFVDIGVHEKGLVHISELADHYVSDPTTVVSLHQQVMARVLHVDLERNRIALSLKNI